MCSKVQRIIATSFMTMVVLVGMAQSYTGAYFTASGTFNRAEKTIEIRITDVTLTDAQSRIVSNAEIDMIEIMRSTDHGSYQKVGETEKVTVTDGKLSQVISWTDTNLPQTTTSSIVSYAVRAVIGSFVSDNSIVTNTEAPDGGGTFLIDYRKYPSAVSNARIECDAEYTQATLSFTAPTHATNGSELSLITAIRLEKYSWETYSWVRVKNFANVRGGTECVYEDTEIQKNQELSYRITPYLGTGTSTLAGNAVTVSRYLGQDYPAKAKNLKTTDDGYCIHVTWEAPDHGANGGDFDPSLVKYRLERQEEGGNSTVVLDNSPLMAYDDWNVSQQYKRYTYTVTPINERGTGDATTLTVAHGLSYKMPFKEEAKQMKMGSYVYDNTGWDSYSVGNNGSSGWGPQSYITDIANEVLVTSTNGVITTLLYPTNPRVGWYDYLVSPPLWLNKNNGVTVDFDLYTQTGFNTTLVVEVSTDDGKTFQEIGTVDFSELTETGWKHFTMASEALESESGDVRVRFTCVKGSHSNSVGIDNIVIDGAVVETGIGSVIITDDAFRGATYNLQGQRINATSAKGIIIRDGKKYIGK